MKAQGLFFLSARPVQVRLQSAADGEMLAWTFRMVERLGGRGTQHATAYWHGIEADMFVRVHQERLKPGLALNLELDRIAPYVDGVSGFITSCSLAPDRWPKTEQDPTAPTTQPQSLTA